jgi:hypothetical protein
MVRKSLVVRIDVEFGKMINEMRKNHVKQTGKPMSVTQATRELARKMRRY